MEYYRIRGNGNELIQSLYYTGNNIMIINYIGNNITIINDGIEQIRYGQSFYYRRTGLLFHWNKKFLLLL